MRTPEQLAAEGFAALVEKLGVADAALVEKLGVADAALVEKLGVVWRTLSASFTRTIRGAAITRVIGPNGLIDLTPTKFNDSWQKCPSDAGQGSDVRTGLDPHAARQ